MREYETMFVIQPEISEEGTAAILEKVDAELTRHGTTRLLCEDWGKRKLAYEIDKFQKGHYRILRYLDDGAVVAIVLCSLAGAFGLLFAAFMYYRRTPPPPPPPSLMKAPEPAYPSQPAYA